MGASVQAQQSQNQIPPFEIHKQPTLADLDVLEDLQSKIFGHNKRTPTHETIPTVQSPRSVVRLSGSGFRQDPNRIPPITVNSYIDENRESSPIPQETPKISQETPKISQETQNIIPDETQKVISPKIINQNTPQIITPPKTEKPVVVIKYIDDDSNIKSRIQQQQQVQESVNITQTQQNTQHLQAIQQIQDQKSQYLEQSQQQAYRVLDDSVLKLQQSNASKEIF